MCVESLEKDFIDILRVSCGNQVIHMDQDDALLISSWAWTLGTELVVEFLCQVLCEKVTQCFCSISLSITKSSFSPQVHFQWLLLLRMRLSHQDIPAPVKMLPLPLLPRLLH